MYLFASLMAAAPAQVRNLVRVVATKVSGAVFLTQGGGWLGRKGIGRYVIIAVYLLFIILTV